MGLQDLLDKFMPKAHPEDFCEIIDITTGEHAQLRTVITNTRKDNDGNEINDWEEVLEIMKDDLAFGVGGG